MNYTIKTIDGEFVRLDNVVDIILPTRDSPYYILTTEEGEYSFPECNVKYCKEELTQNNNKEKVKK
jgi:hypothetical protein